MPTVVLENVPPEVYDRLQQRAAARQRSVPEELLHLVRQVLQGDADTAARLPDLIPHDEIPAPCDLPRSSQPVPVTLRQGAPRLPDPPSLVAPE